MEWQQGADRDVTIQTQFLHHDGASDPAAVLGEAAQTLASRFRRPSLAPIWITCIAASFDLLAFSLAAWFALFAAAYPGAFAPLTAAFAALATGTGTTALLALARRYSRRHLRDARRATALAALAALLPCTLLWIWAPAGADQDLGAAMAVSFALAIIPSRLTGAAAMRWLEANGLTARRAVVAGGGDHAARLIRELSTHARTDIEICALFDDREDDRSPLQVLGVPKVGGFEELVGFVREAEIDMLIIALPLDAEARIRWLLDRFRVLPVEVRLSAFSEGYRFAGREDGLISAMSRSFSPERRLTKRIFDLAFASAALVALSPVLAAAALAVRLDSPGPVLFRQKRHGYNNRIIEVLKFRSMRSDACDPDARRVVTREDDRVTRVGRFLRRSSIDELPQLWNVLRGELSLVGPRPHAVTALTSDQRRFSQIVEGYSARHRLPPGITGWAQINGWRGEIDDPEKLRARFNHDLYYIENWSVLLDFKILLRTPLSLLDTRGAY